MRRVDPISRPAVLAEGWALDVAHEGDVRINGVACGEFDTELAGDEIVSVDKLGRIRLLGRRDGGFGPLELPWPLPMEGISGSREPGGELVQVAAGDLDPEAPGDEIVAVGVLRGGEDDGEPGLVRVLSRSGPGGAWREQRFVTPGLVHAIAVGDVLPAREGLEVLFAGFFGEALVGYVDRGAARSSSTPSARRTPATPRAPASWTMASCSPATTARPSAIAVMPRGNGRSRARVTSERRWRGSPPSRAWTTRSARTTGASPSSAAR